MFARPDGRRAAPMHFGVSAFAVAALASAATKILYVTATKLTSPVNAILLQHTAPVWAALAAGFLLRERVRPAQWFAVVLAASGSAVFFLRHPLVGRPTGDFIALLSGITFALSMLALRSLKDASPALALFFSHLITAAIGLPFVIAAPPALSAADIARVAFLGLVQVGAASLFYAYAIKRLSAINAMLIAQLEPVLGPLWLFIFAGSIPTCHAIAGGAAIIAAVVVSSIGTAGEPPVHDGHRFFPLFLPIAGKRVLIIGGGNIALRRTQTLLQFDCRVHIIAEKPREELEKIAAGYAQGERAVTIERRAFCPGDCTKDGRPLFVIAATDTRGVNHAIAEECRASDIPVSVADCKEESTFFFPAIAIHDIIVAGISSGGKDHGAVRRARAVITEALKKHDHTNRQP
jgi:siroheme synthase-like protein